MSSSRSEFFALTDQSENKMRSQQEKQRRQFSNSIASSLNYSISAIRRAATNEKLNNKKKFSDPALRLPTATIEFDAGSSLIGPSLSILVGFARSSTLFVAHSGPSHFE